MCVYVFVVLGSFGLFVNEVCGQHDILYRDTWARARVGEPGLDKILFKILGIPPLISQNTHPIKNPITPKCSECMKYCIYLAFFKILQESWALNLW